jgi:glycosyltransferase involved in cell wall biosynthesis
MPTYGVYLADLVRGRSASHGIANYAVGLVTALPAALRADERLVVYVNDTLVGELAALQQEPSCDVRVSPSPRLPFARLRHTQLRAPAVAVRDRVDVLHFPGAMMPFYRLPGPRWVATIHDDLPRAYRDGGPQVGLPGDGRPTSGSRHRAFGRGGCFVLGRCRIADQVVVVSEFTRQRLAAASGSERMDTSRLTVIHQGITVPLIPFVPTAERVNRLIHFASAYPHKRSAVAIDWALRYADSHGGNLEVMVLGSLPEGVSHLIRHPRIRHLTGTLSTADIADLVARSRGLLFASTYEGFGLPPVEAYSLGTAATYAWSAASHEAMAGTPGGHDPDDYDEFERAMDTVLALSDPELMDLRARFRRTYAWDRAAAETLEVYRSAAATRSPHRRRSR